ncbi:putative lipase/esterase [Arcticibacter svalbardensis MN12-7]|uniref:Putative lipase/esterase n=1 Tax=Arcticibacter svalbardensis MN12-7 TaxID=1150600 RepID=R9H0Y3_9SPHI|nr:alpha/beta hydrolase [Arcticibacter svalbardensis]EOR94899.1 putative lipase/esterase [Arcticibacter svalbardensis MN12-7]
MKRIISLCCLVGFGFSSIAQDVVQIKKVVYPSGYEEQLNVVYTTAANWEGKMDLYLPAKERGPSPVIINIHGGGWNKGNKESQTGFSNFFKKGYAVANIEYRLVQVAPAPAAVEDTRCALIYLIKNAKQLNIDVNRIVIMGGSSGGHLALMGGLLANNHLFDINCKGVEQIKVAAIIDKYGITDLWDWAFGPNKTSKSATMWLGERARDEAFAKSVSPITYVSKLSPPTFIVHGNEDPIVPYQESEALHKKLLEAGVKTEFITAEGGLHGNFPKDKNTEVNAAIMAFLKDLDIHN